MSDTQTCCENILVLLPLSWITELRHSRATMFVCITLFDCHNFLLTSFLVAFLRREALCLASVFGVVLDFKMPV